MAIKAEKLIRKGKPTGEYYVIIVRENKNMFVTHSNGGYFYFSTDYTSATRYYKSDAEIVKDCLERLKAEGKLRFETVYIREIRKYNKKNRIRVAKQIFAPDIDEIKVYVQEVSKVGNIAKNKSVKLVKPKAGLIVNDKNATKKMVTNGVPAESPKQIFEFIVKPYNSINDMPVDYIYNTVMKYFNSLVAEIRDNNNKIIDYKWVGIPDKRGLALSLGCSADAIDKYINTYDNSDTNNSNINTQLDIISSINSVANFYSNPNINNLNTNSKYTTCTSVDIREISKSLSALILKRALGYIEYYKVKCLYSSAAVGAMFDLKCNYGWQERQSVTIEAGQSLLGRQKSEAELARMAAAIEGCGTQKKICGAEFTLDGVSD